MSFQPGANLYGVAIGSRPEGVEVPHIDIRSPTSSDVRYELGKRWLNTVSNAEYVLSSQNSIGAVLSSNWVLLGVAGGALNTLTTGDSTVVVPSSGNINLTGVGSIATTGSGSTASISLTASPSVTGSLTAGTTITATLGAITATNGNLVFGTAGNKISAPAATTNAAGANSFGRVPLVAGTIVVATTAVTANSIIQLTAQNLGTVTAPSALTVSARSAGVSFTILASQATDTSTIGWMIIN